MDIEELSEDELLTLAETFEDPTIFSEVYLNRKLWSVQNRIAQSTIKNRKTAVKACHGSGKSYVAACVTLAWLNRYPSESLVITTAPTWNQVENVLWAEIRDAVEYARKMGTLVLPACNKTELNITNKVQALGLSTNEGVRFQGLHNANILIIMDEAPGIKPGIIEACEGIRAAGNVNMLWLGNPVIPSGHFYDAFNHPTESASWNKFTISAFDTPNFAEYRTLEKLLKAEQSTLEEMKLPVPSLTRPAWVREMYSKWGVNNPNWHSRVEGNFPKQSSFAVFPAEWVHRAARDCPVVDKFNRIDIAELFAMGHVAYVGIDVAGPGEDTSVMYIRVGGNIVAKHVYSDPDPYHGIMRDLRAFFGSLDSNKLAGVNIDSNGIGYGLACALLRDGLPVTFCNFGEGAMHNDRFANMRAEMYWHFREWLERDLVTGLTCIDTQGELTSILYQEQLGGRVAIESKADAKKRGMSSPDLAEGLIYAFADPPREGTIDVRTGTDDEDEDDEQFRRVSKY